jgi:signal transduction histidine kinase
VPVAENEIRYTLLSSTDDGIDRVRLLNLIAYLLGGFGAFFSVYGFALGSKSSSVPVAVATVLALLTPTLVRRTRRYDHATIGLLFSFYLAIFLAHGLSGNGAFYLPFWGILLPVIAWALAGRQAAWWSVAGVVFAYSAFFISDFWGYVAWSHPPKTAVDMVLSLCSIAGAVVVCTVLFGAVFEADRRARIALREARDVARHAEAEKAKLVSYLSHELRTPIAGIIGAGELLVMEEGEPADRQVVNILIQASRQLLEMTDELLEVYRSDTNSPATVAATPFRVEPLLAGAIALCRPLALQQDIDVSLRSVGRNDLVLGYPQRVRQVMHNLLVNALVHSEGRTVRLAASRGGYQGNHELWTCSVTDDGRGVSDPSQAFGAYERLDARSSGMGLGLAVARELAASMGGTVTHSVPTGGGARFELRFPVSLVNADPSSAP